MPSGFRFWRAALAIALFAAPTGPLRAQASPSASAPPRSAASAPAPARLYAQLPFMADAVLSPDGRRILAKVTDGGTERLGIWTLSQGPDQQPVTFAAPDVQSFQWAGDNRILVTMLSVGIAVVSGSLVVGGSQRVLVHDLRQNKTVALHPGRGTFDELIFVDPAGAYVLIASQPRPDATPSVYRVDLATGVSVEVEPARPGVWKWFADARGVVRVGLDETRDRARLHYRDVPGAALRTVAMRRTQEAEETIDSIQLLTGSSRATIVTNSATGRFGVYEYDLATDTRGAAAFEHPEVDVTTAIVGSAGTLDGVRYDDDRPRHRWFNPQMAALQAEVDRTFRSKTNVIVNRSLDGNRALIWSSAADDPGTYYVYDRDSRRMEAFASPYDLLQGVAHSEVRPIRYRSRDGLTINGYLTLPRGRGERGLPLVVLPHGGPFLRDNWTFDPEVQFLASRGYAVLQVNFRGSTGYGRSFVARGFGQLGTGMINDLEDGVDWLAGQGTIDPRRVCIMGSSYGGYAASWAVIRSPARYRCAISFAGPSDLRTMLRHTARGFAARRYFRAFQRQIEGEPATDLDAVSPARHARLLRVPLLIGHGRRDPIVPVEQSERLIAALRRQRAPVESIIFPKSGHGFNDAAERENFLTIVEGFLTRHNPAAAAPAG